MKASDTYYYKHYRLHAPAVDREHLQRISNDATDVVNVLFLSASLIMASVMSILYIGYLTSTHNNSVFRL